MRMIYEIKREQQNFKEQLKKLYEENTEHALACNFEAIERNKKEIASIETSLNVLSEELNRRERETKIPVHTNNPINNRAVFYRSILNKETIPEEIKRNLFGVDLTPSTGAEKLIPTTLSNELLHEPLQHNPLREIMIITNIKRLEIPKITYELNNMEFKKDGETAQEVDLKGDKVAFGRFKFKVMSSVSDTVIYSADNELVNYIENALKEGLAEREIRSIFETNIAGEEHMNLYHSSNGIKEVEGETLFKAIKNSLSNLHYKYYRNATIVMRMDHYYNMIEELSNGNTDFYQIQPEQIFGKRIVFCEYATKPIIGDFKYLHLNYDIDTVLESDKDIKNGENYFVLTAWADIRVKLSSAFRIAKITNSDARTKKD